MRITKLDILIVLIIAVWLYFSFAGAKYFEVKGQDVFGAIMTYNTLSERGFGMRADVIGTGLDSQKPVKISGIILGSSGEKIYLWDGDTTWVIFQKERFLEMEQMPQTPYLFPSSITLYPSESFRVTGAECSEDSFSSEYIYVTLDRPASQVLCSYLSRNIWEDYGGEVECIHGENQIELKLTLLKGFSSASLGQMVSELGYKAGNVFSSGRECLVIEYD